MKIQSGLIITALYFEILVPLTTLTICWSSVGRVNSVSTSLVTIFLFVVLDILIQKVTR